MAAVLVDIAKPTPPKAAVPALLHDAPNQPLTAFDRCDCSAIEQDKRGRKVKGTCGAQAQVRVTLSSGPQILFCGHHFGDHGPKVVAVAKVATVYDERAQAAARESSTTITARTPLVSAK